MRRKVIAMLAAAACALMMAACSSGGTVEVTYEHIDADAAKALMEDPGCIVVDVRGEPSYDYQHIPGAVNIVYDEGWSDYSSILKDKGQAVLIYCDYGGVSKQAAEDLAADGFTNVFEFDGLEVWDGELEGEALE